MGRESLHTEALNNQSLQSNGGFNVHVKGSFLVNRHDPFQLLQQTETLPKILKIQDQIEAHERFLSTL